MKTRRISTNKSTVFPPWSVVRTEVFNCFRGMVYESQVFLFSLKKRLLCCFILSQIHTDASRAVIPRCSSTIYEEVPSIEEEEAEDKDERNDYPLR